MEQFLSDHYMGIGIAVAVFITVFGLVWTVLERRLVVSRKHVTGWSGFTSVVVGGLLCAFAAYFPTENVLHGFLVLAAVIAIYVLICILVPKNE